MVVCNVLRSDFGDKMPFTLFNLEGIRLGEPFKAQRSGLCDDDGGIAQLEEHLLCKQGVIGSSPITSTNKRVDRYGPIAQLARAHD